MTSLRLTHQSQRLGACRPLHCCAPVLATGGEKRITKLLQEKLAASHVEVTDISGGCGSMYEIWVESEVFAGKRTLQQHRLVNEALGDEFDKLHGLTIRIGRRQ